MKKGALESWRLDDFDSVVNARSGQAGYMMEKVARLRLGTAMTEWRADVVDMPSPAI